MYMTVVIVFTYPALLCLVHSATSLRHEVYPLQDSSRKHSQAFPPSYSYSADKRTVNFYTFTGVSKHWLTKPTDNYYPDAISMTI